MRGLEQRNPTLKMLLVKRVYEQTGLTALAGKAISQAATRPYGCSADR